MKVKSESEVAQSFPTLRDPMDCSLPGSCTHGIFQARVLEWVAIAFSYKYQQGYEKLSSPAGFFWSPKILSLMIYQNLPDQDFQHPVDVTV